MTSGNGEFYVKAGVQLPVFVRNKVAGRTEPADCATVE